MVAVVVVTRSQHALIGELKMNIRLPKLGPRIVGLLLAGFMSITATPLAMAEPETVTDAIRAQLIKAGMLPGYLDSSNMPSGIAFLPPPPVTDSAAERADRDANSRILSSSTPDRLALARVDADTRFPQAPQPFACTLGIEINENSTPAIYRLMKRCL